VDADGIEQAYRESHRFVFQFLYKRLRHHETAEDLTAETFARALARWDSYTERGSCRQAWLVTIARNLLADHLKSARVRCEVPTADMYDADRVAPDVWEQVQQTLYRTTVNQALRGLVPNQRRCLELRFLRDLSIKETSAALAISDGAAKQLQLRAMEAVRCRITTGAYR